jgi:SPP1 gp7 family putative phage head morphogenesis protein
MFNKKLSKPKELEPVATPESHSEDLRLEVKRLLKILFFDPMLTELEATKNNSKSKNKLIKKIEDGDVTYQGDTFIGDLDAMVGQILKGAGAKFSRPNKGWKIPLARMPLEIQAAVDKQRASQDRLEKHAREMIARVEQTALNIMPKVSLDMLAEAEARKMLYMVDNTIPNALSVQPKLDKDQAAALAKSYTDNVKLSIVGFIQDETARFRKNILPEIRKGMGRKDLQEYVKQRLKVGNTRAKFIARQETSLFTSKIKEVQYRQANIRKYRWKAIGGKRGDGRTRDAHMEAHGKEFFWDHSKNKNPVRNSEGQPVHPGQDFNCFIGDTSIELIGDIVRAYKRRYEGTIIRFKSNAGRWTSVTPNHPILTTRGWVAAKHLNEGDELVQRFNSDVINVFHSKINYRHPTASEIYDFFAVSNSFERSCGSYQQFHGDGIEHQEVNIITVKSELRSERDTVGNKKVGDYVFASPNVTHAFLASLGDSSSLFNRTLTTFSSEVCGLDLIASHLGTHARPLSFLRLTLRSEGDATLFQSNINTSSCDSIAFRKFIDTYSLPIERTDLLRRNIFAVVGYQSFFESVMISEIKHETFSGDVFNFETTENVYIANQVIASNCRCIAVPIVEEII